MSIATNAYCNIIVITILSLLVVVIASWAFFNF